MDNKASILIVDDDRAFRKTLAQILNKKGYEVFEAENGVQAMGLVKERPFSIVLMDIKMPIMDGVLTYKKLKTIRPGVSVIMMTAFAVDDLIADAIKEGAHGVLRKPFDIDAAIRMIEGAKNGCLLAIVDDDPGICRSMKLILEKKGHSVVTCSSAKECISIAKEKAPDIFFIDMKMPVMNGLETFLEIKKINPKVVGVMMTAYRQETDELVKQAIENGSYCCLYKPFDMDEVLRLIDEISKKKT